MQRDLDRLLRDARAALGEPGGEREERAVERALAARSRRPAWRAALIAALMLVALTASLGAVAAVVVPERGPSAAEQAPLVRTVDRTYACRVKADTAGERRFGVGSRSSSRSSTGERWPAEVYVAGAPGPVFVSELVVARSHVHEQRQRAQRGFGPWHEGVYVNARACTPSRVTVPLTAAGLEGPPSPHPTGASCVTRGRILVRIRATLAAPARWRELQEPYVGVRANVTQMAVAVRLEQGPRPVGYGTARPASSRFWQEEWPLCR